MSLSLTGAGAGALSRYGASTTCTNSPRHLACNSTPKAPRGARHLCHQPPPPTMAVAAGANTLQAKAHPRLLRGAEVRLCMHPSADVDGLEHYLGVDHPGLLARGYAPLADDDIDRAPEGEVVHIEERRNKRDSADMSSVLNQCFGPASPQSPRRILLQKPKARHLKHSRSITVCQIDRSSTEGERAGIGVHKTMCKHVHMPAMHSSVHPFTSSCYPSQISSDSDLA